jgi:hypothetical protein
VQQLKPGDGIARQHFAEEMLVLIDLDVDFLKKTMFTDEATFHVSGKVHRHNVRIMCDKHKLIHILILFLSQKL